MTSPCRFLSSFPRRAATPGRRGPRGPLARRAGRRSRLERPRTGSAGHNGPAQTALPVPPQTSRQTREECGFCHDRFSLPPPPPAGFHRASQARAGENRPARRVAADDRGPFFGHPPAGDGRLGGPVRPEPGRTGAALDGLLAAGFFFRVHPSGRPAGLTTNTPEARRSRWAADPAFRRRISGIGMGFFAADHLPGAPPVGVDSIPGPPS